VRLGAAQLTTKVAADGRLSVEIRSDVAIDAPEAVRLMVARRIPATAASTTTPSTAPTLDLLPTFRARRVDAHHARADLYLDVGDYMLSAAITSGTILAQAPVVAVQIAHVKAPPVTDVEAFGIPDDEGRAAPLLYRTPNGASALLRRPIDEIPQQQSQADGPVHFEERVRSGPFTWQTDSYTVTTETISDDGKKTAALTDFAYDPIARRYEIEIESQLPQRVEDRLTVQALGPHGVVIYEESVPIVLEPGQPLRHAVSVPTDRGEPAGLRIRVHDPLGIDWLIEKTSNVLTSLFNAITGAAGSKVELKAELIFLFSIELVFGIELLSLQLSCTFPPYLTCGNWQKTGLVFESPSDWPQIVIDGIRDFLRETFLDEKGEFDIEKIIENELWNGLDLGTVSLGAAVGGTAILTADPGKCPEAIEHVKRQVENLGDSLEELGLLITAKARPINEALKQPPARLQFPLAWILGLRIEFTFLLKARGGKSGDLSVFGELLLDFGSKGSVVLKASTIFDALEALRSAAKWAKIAYYLYDLVVTAVPFWKLFKTSLDAPGNNCDPPPPNGGPDDRLDAFQNVFPPTPTGASGQISYLQQQIAIANRLGLARAATYWTLQLRQQELTAFVTDTDRATKQTADLNRFAGEADVQMTGLISGTILPAPGQTITDALQLAYDTFIDRASNTTYEREQRTILSNLEFAQRRYSELRGQELELQRELRLMNQTGGVGILDSGLVTWALTAVGSVGIEAVPVQIVPGITSSRLANSRYYSPYEAPPVLIVPSGGLHRYGPSQQARAWLDAYVSSGGTLIVFTQADSEDWTLLPGGQVQGLGYNQDILCKTASVRIVNPSPWIAGIERDLPDIQIDGSFTAWPNNATIVLMRTTGNQMPAMIEYAYGSGQVIATSSYPDFYINGMQSGDDIVFARSLFSLAYLESTGQIVADTVAPGQTATIVQSVTNTTAVTATQITVWSDYYNSHIGESWRWSAHQPYQLRANQIIHLVPPLPSGATREVSLSFTVPQRAGIFRTGYFLGSAASWWSSEAIAGPFYQVQSPTVNVDLPRFQLVRDQDMYAFGATAIITASLQNSLAMTRTFVLEPLTGLATEPLTVTIGPKASLEQVYRTRVFEPHEVRIGVSENGRTLSRLLTTLRLRPATLGIDTDPKTLVAGKEISTNISATASNVAPGTLVTWEVRRNGTLVAAPTTPLVAGPGYTSASTDVTLPAAAPGASYTVRAALPGTALAMTQTLNVVAPLTLRGAAIVGPLTIGTTNPSALAARIAGTSYGGTADLQVLVQQSGTTLTAGPIVTVPIGSAVQTVTLDVTLPPALDLNQIYSLVVSANGRADGAATSYEDTFGLPLPLHAPATTLVETTRQVRQPLNLRIASLPGDVTLPASGPYTVTLRGVTTPFTETVVIDEATPVGGALELITSVPELLQGGIYEFEAQSARLRGWRATREWNVPAHHITYTVPASVRAGATLQWAARNDGGVDTSLSGTLALADATGVIVAQTPIDEQLLASTALTLSLTLPEQLAGGRYILRWRGTDHLDQPLNEVWAVMIEGLQATLQSRTDRPAYLTTDTISTTSTIVVDTPLEGAQLRLQVLKSTVAWDGWRGVGANGGRTNSIAAGMSGPFTSTWSTLTRSSIVPVAIGDLVLTLEQHVPPPPPGLQADAAAAFEDGAQLVAHDSANGTVLWQTAVGGAPSELAANSQLVFVLSDNSLKAFDIQSGALRWMREINDGWMQNLLVSETAMAIYSSATASYLLVNPANGSERGTLSTDHIGALLVENSLYLVLHALQGRTLIAYNAETGAERWRASLPADTELLAANTLYVLSAQNTSEGNTVLYVHNSATGQLVRSAGLAIADAVPFPVVLQGTRVFYLGFFESSGGRQNALYRLDLTTGDQLQIYTSSSFLEAMIGAGDQIYFLRFYESPILVSIDTADQVVQEQNLSDLPCCDLDGLAVSNQGLLVLASRGYSVYALQASVPIGGTPTQQLHVLREEWIPVAGEGTLTYDLPLISPNLLDDPRARGQLYLYGTLFSRDPSGASPTERQVLASSRYGFRVDEASASVVLTTDRPAYRADLPGYTPDDTESRITLNGIVRNTSTLASPITLSIQRDDGMTILNQTFPNMAPGETRSFTVGDPAPPSGSVTYSATTTLGGETSVGIIVRPAAVSAVATASSTTIARSETTTLQLTLTNDSTVPAFVTADLGAGPQDNQLAVGATLSQTQIITPAGVGLLTLPITLTGDLSRIETVPITVRDETAAATLALVGTTRDASTVVQGDDAGLAITLNNAQTFSFDAIVDYAISGPQARTGSELRTLAPGTTTITVALGTALPGDYTASVIVRHARLGSAIDTLIRPFSIVAPRWELTLDASASTIVADGNPRIQVRAANAATSDRLWSGSLVFTGALEQRAPLVIAIGDEHNTAISLPLSERAGPQTIEIALIDSEGVVAASRTLLVNAAPRLAPRTLLTNLSAAPGSAGGMITLTATVSNDGPAGDALLTFVAFDETYQQIGAVAANGQSEITLSVPVPDGLLNGVYPASVRLGEQELQTDLSVEGPEVDLRQHLNASSYAPFGSATWTVELEGVRGGPASYDVILRYGSAEFTRTITLSVGQIVAVPWTFDVGPASDRAAVLVTSHPANEAQSRYTVLIDSRYILVREDARTWLESDKASYQAGETVNLTLHLTQATRAALVLAPDDMPGSSGALLWSSPPTGATTEPGDIPITYTLPAVVRTGRYFIRFIFDGEERTLPIDVHGSTVQVEELVVRGPTPNAPLAPGDQLAITARVRLDRPVADAVIRASILTPDGTYRTLGAGAEQSGSLPAGDTAISLTGVLDTNQPGAHQVVLKIFDRSSGLALGGDATFVDVGRAVLGSLTTDRGLYAPGDTGTGTVTLYGSEAASLRVTTSDNTALLDQTVALAGYRRLNFSLPTATERDEVVIATLTDSHGMTSTLQVAYKVAATLDTTAPQVQVLTPPDGTVVDLIGNTGQIMLTGIVTEETALQAVLVNGEPATLDGSRWSAPVRIERDLNVIDVVGLDRAGNIGTVLHSLVGQPAYGISLSVSPTVGHVGDTITFESLITSTETVTVTALFPFSAILLQPLDGSASSGTLTLDQPVGWTGVITPDTPVHIRWTGRSTGVLTGTIHAFAHADGLIGRISNPIDMLITNPNPTPTDCRVYAVHDAGRSDSQFFTIDLRDHTTQALGPLYRGLDIEALDMHPITQVLYATGRGHNGKDLFIVDRQSGALTRIGRTGFRDVDALSFRPTDATLWGWARGAGLIRIDLTTGAGTLVFRSHRDVEGLAWNNDGSTLYATSGKRLYIYDPIKKKLTQLAANLPGATEGLEMRPDGLLALGIDGSTTIYAYNISTKQLVPSQSISVHSYDDVEGIAWPMSCSAPLP